MLEQAQVNVRWRTYGVSLGTLRERGHKQAITACLYHKKESEEMLYDVGIWIRLGNHVFDEFRRDLMDCVTGGADLGTHTVAKQQDLHLPWTTDGECGQWIICLRHLA
jgi:hypothetical protein